MAAPNFEGLTPDGLDLPTGNEWLQIVRESIDDQLDSPESLPYTQNDVLGALTAEMAFRLAQLSEALQSIENSKSVQTASGVHLEDLVSLVGVQRDAPRPSIISDQKFIGDFLEVIPTGKTVRGGGPGDNLEWTTQDVVELGWEIAPKKTSSDLSGEQTGSLPTGGYILEIGKVNSPSTSYSANYNLGTPGDQGALLRNWEEILENSRISDLISIEIRDIGTDGDDDVMIIRSPKGFDLDVSASVPAGADIETTKGVGFTQIEAEEDGPYLADQTSVDEVVDQIQNVDTTRNVVEARTGQNRDTDAELRLDHGRRLQRNATASANAIRSKIDELEFIEATVVLENETDQAVTTQQFDLDPNSIGIVVWPDSFDTEQEREIARTIYDNVSHGIKIVEDTNFTRFSRKVETVGQNEKEIYIHYAQELTVNVDVTASFSGPFTDSDIRTQTSSAIREYLADLSVSEDVLRLEIYGLIDDIEPVDKVSSLKLNTSASDITVDAVQIAEPGTIDVTF